MSDVDDARAEVKQDYEDLGESLKKAGEAIDAEEGGGGTPPEPPDGGDVTWVATETAPGQATGTWAGASPTKIGRDGTDTTGAGPWDTGPLVDQPTEGDFAFSKLKGGDTYELTMDYAGGQKKSSVKMSGSSGGGGSSGYPGKGVPWVPAGYKVPGRLVRTYDFTMMDKLDPDFVPSWFGNIEEQNGTWMKAENVSMGADGIVHRFNGSDMTGSIVSTNPQDGQHQSGKGWTMVPTQDRPIFRQTFAPKMSAECLKSWLAIWSAGLGPWAETGEIDDMETFGSTQVHLQAPIGAAPPGWQGSVWNPAIHGPWQQPGDHCYGIMWWPGKVEAFFDGVSMGTLETAGYQDDPQYTVFENSNNGTAVESNFYIAHHEQWQD